MRATGRPGRCWLRFTSIFVKNCARSGLTAFSPPRPKARNPTSQTTARPVAAAIKPEIDPFSGVDSVRAAALWTTVVASVLAIAGTVAAETGPTRDDAVEIELNRFEPREGGCQAYIVIRNPGTVRHESLRLDVVLFDRAGVVARRMAVQAGPVPPEKTSVRVFAIDGVACEDAGALLLNDVLDCAAGTGCLDAVRVSASPPLIFMR